MNVLNSYSKGLAILALSQVVAGLLLAACGTSETEDSSASQSTDATSSSETGGATAIAENDLEVDESISAVTESEVEEGSDVGQKIPAFYIRDASATKITSEEIFASGRPSFFYFFTTW